MNKEVSYIITLGFFDGIHKGHNLVLDKLKEIGLQENLNTLVFTFDKHPRNVLSNKGIEYILTSSEKVNILKDKKIDKVEIINFTKEFAQQSFKEFLLNDVLKKYNVKAILLGYDNTIGKDKTGTYEELLLFTKKYGINIYKSDVSKIQNQNVSSTLIRQKIKEGKINEANKLLEYNYFFSGVVVEGKKIGRKISFPTANLIKIDKVLPLSGVFCVKVYYKNNSYFGMLNIGVNPTVSENNIQTVEVNIFDFNKDIYNKHLKIEFISKIRAEVKFLNLEELKIQIQKDKEECLNRKK